MPAFQGTYYTRTFALKQDGVAIDISGWTFEAQVRYQVDDDEALLTLTTANGGVVTIDGSSGRLALAITADQTAALPEGRVVFDVLRTDADPGPLWQFGGQFIVKQPVTREDS